MKSINFDEGYEEFKINDDDSRIICIRVADPNLVTRLEKAIEEVSSIEKELEGKATEEQVAVSDEKLRDILNRAFDADICTPAFGNASPFTIVNGKRLYEVFFDAFLPMLEGRLKVIGINKKADQPQLRPEAAKYLEPVRVTSAAKPVAGLADPNGSGLPDISRLSTEEKRALLAQLIPT